MNPEFWLENWKNNKIGFHQQATNPYLLAFWRQLNFDSDCDVFVPLCGKSLDLIWLNKQGHQVIGVEVSDLAVNSFFAENHLPYKKVKIEDFERFQAERITLFQGDFFKLKADHLVNVQGVFDRGALVALPSALRESYAKHLISILPCKARILLVVFEYDQSEMQGPPFSVSESEVQTLFQNAYDIELLLGQDVLEFFPQFKTAGLSSLEEKVYLLSKF